MLQQRLASQRMQDFRQRGLHALSHAGGKDDYIHKPFSKQELIR
jgi:DNA-binding response OmpR family regulator